MGTRWIHIKVGTGNEEWDGWLCLHVLAARTCVQLYIPIITTVVPLLRYHFKKHQKTVKGVASHWRYIA